MVAVLGLFVGKLVRLRELECEVDRLTFNLDYQTRELEQQQLPPLYVEGVSDSVLYDFSIINLDRMCPKQHRKLTHHTKADIFRLAATLAEAPGLVGQFQMVYETSEGVFIGDAEYPFKGVDIKSDVSLLDAEGIKVELEFPAVHLRRVCKVYRMYPVFQGVIYNMTAAIGPVDTDTKLVLTYTLHQ
jgi:hypothetical protein